MISCSNDFELRRCRPLLGTFVEITARGPDTVALSAAIEAAYSAIGRTQSLLSYHDSSSELSLLNREASLRPIRVDAWTRQVLVVSQRIHAASNGDFDPTIAPCLESAGLLPRLAGAPRASARASMADVIF